MTRLYLVEHNAGGIKEAMRGRMEDPEAWWGHRHVYKKCVPFDVETDLRAMVRGTMEGTRCQFDQWQWGSVKAYYSVEPMSDGRFGYWHCEVLYRPPRCINWICMEFDWRFGTEREKRESDIRAIKKELRSLGMMVLDGLELPNELEREVLRFVQL